MSSSQAGIMLKDSDPQKVDLVESSQKPCGVELVNPYRTNKFDANDLVSLAQQIQKADTFVQANVSNKLKVIVDQIRFLQQQAKQVMQEAKDNYSLHHIPCNFVPKPGHIFYLYKRPSGQRYFSMLSPQEWGNSCPHEYEGAYRLEHDQSWTPVEKLQEKDSEQELICKILGRSNALSLTVGD